MHPRRVRGGIKLPGAGVDGPALWAAQRWLRLVEAVAPGGNISEGLEYAKLGQTKRLTIGLGHVEAAVQGRQDKPYTTRLTVPMLDRAQWEQVLGVMSEGAVYAAKLLAGELPTSIEDVFAPRSLKLFPTEGAEVTVSCTCLDHRAAAGTPRDAGATSPDARWCKHVCCVSHLLAQSLANEPFQIFTLRGLDPRELLELLRDRRAAASTTPGRRAPVYAQQVPGIAELRLPSLEEAVQGFWDAGADLDALDMPLEAPALSHPLLRRLGPSPFPAATFPLVGLLASCYDSISAAAMRRSEARAEAPAEDAEPE